MLSFYIVNYMAYDILTNELVRLLRIIVIFFKIYVITWNYLYKIDKSS